MQTMQTLDYPKDYCGVFGVFGHENAAELTYYGLRALQHRGQESAGIVTSNGAGPFKRHCGMGLVKDVFTADSITKLAGKNAVGHTRYSTSGTSDLRNAQPLLGAYGTGEEIALAHNGNLTNASELRNSLVASGTLFQTNVDSELILLLLGKARGKFSIEVDALIHTLQRLQGAYALALLTNEHLIGIRDPCGFRPLSIGKKDGGWFLSSETCAFDQTDTEFIRDVLPGEIVFIDANGPRSAQAFPEHTLRASCIFEWVYFARPDSNLSGQNVYAVRKRMGHILAREHPVEADIVVPIPDGGVPAALGYAEELGIPIEMAFVRAHFAGRSFIQPTQIGRELSARVKLNLIKGAVKDKRVVIVDDSIVRGTTCKARIGQLKEAGATEVHIRVSCPPHKHQCVYGIDFPDPKKLLAVKLSMEEICKFLNADSLGYLSIKGMVDATGIPLQNFCLACYTGNYPVPYQAETEARE